MEWAAAFLGSAVGGQARKEAAHLWGGWGKRKGVEMRLRRTKGNGGGKDHPRPRRLGGCTLGRHGALHGSGGCAAAAYRHTECTCRAFVRTWCSCVNAGSARARPQSCRRGLLRAGFPLRALDRVEHHLGGLACCSMALGIGLHEFLTESKAWLTGMEVGGGLRNESRSKGRQAKNGPLAFPPQRRQQAGACGRAIVYLPR